MSEINRAVVHFLDGNVLKGTTEDFFANRPSFHLQVVGAGSSQVIVCKQLKAVFFVKDFAGNPNRKDMKGFGHVQSDQNLGKKIAILFKDGELVAGYTFSYAPDRDGFFVASADPQSNNIRIYVLKHAAQKVMVGAQAEAFAKQYFPEAA